MSTRGVMFAVLVLMVLAPQNALAALDYFDTAANSGVLDEVMKEFSSRTSAWKAAIAGVASFIFWTLGTISFVWTLGMLALRKADIGEFFSELIRFILFFGFFYWLLLKGPQIAIDIMNSMQQLGDKAAGTGKNSPSTIINIGFLIWKQIISALSVKHPIDSFVGVAVGLALLIVIALIAVNMLLVIISAWFLMYAGIIFLGFGGSRWTSDIAVNYFKTIFGIGIQLFAMVLILGVGIDLANSFYGKMGKSYMQFEELGVMLVFSLCLLLLVSKIPPLLAGIITGASVGNTGGIGGYGAGAAVGAAALAGAAAATAGATMAAGAANIAGTGQALAAAYRSASGVGQGGGGSHLFGGSSMTSEAGSTGSLAQAMGAGGRESSIGTAAMGTGVQTGGWQSAAGFGKSGSGDSPTSAGHGGSGGRGEAGSGSLAGPAPTGASAGFGSTSKASPSVAGAAIGMAGALARGAKDAAGTKLGATMDAARARIGETVGGKIAAEINNPGAAATARRDNKDIARAQAATGTQSRLDAARSARSFLSGDRPAPAFSSDSLSGVNNNAVDSIAEIAAFRDRKST